MTEASTRPITVATAAETRDVRFGDDMERQIEDILARYPEPGAALLPVLWLCQERWGWLAPGVLSAVGERLGLAPAFVEGVASFYTMFQLAPPGRHIVQVCSTLSCQLCGAGDLIDHLKRRLDIGFGDTTPDGAFTLVDVQCLGACGEAPVIQINDDYYTDLTVESLDAILDRLESS